MITTFFASMLLPAFKTKWFVFHPLLCMFNLVIAFLLDPATKAFLSDNVDNVFGFPSLVRFSWSTTEKMLEGNAATVLW